MRVIKNNLEIFLVVIGIVQIWRGIWGLADIYLFPDSPELSFATSIILGAVFLFINRPRDKDISELF